MTPFTVSSRPGPLRSARWTGTALARLRIGTLGLAIVGSAMVVASPAGASAQTVTNCKDSGAGSLRQAVASATSGTVISFLTSPACSVIDLASTIALTTPVTIDGPGAGALALDVPIHVTAFSVSAGVTATVSGLTINNGSTGISNAGTLTVAASTLSNNGGTAGGGIVNSGRLTVTGTTLAKNGVDVTDEGGGAIVNNGGTVAVTGSTFTDNTASGGDNGGAIFNNGGSVTVTGSLLTGNNTSHGSGGALYNNGGTTIITTSTLSDNSALDGTGGAIDNNSGTVTVSDDTLAHNSAFYSVGGGAIYNAATTTVNDSTLFGNSATFGGEGGAILNTGTLAVTASTFSHNAAAGDGGALYGPATVSTTILAQNTEGGNCSQTVTDGGHNLSDDATCGFTAGTDFSNVPADLAPGGLTDNGGPTKTIALEAASPAVGAVKSAALCAVADQRGTSRPNPCDIGAIQLALAPQVITSPDSANATVGTPFSFVVTTTGVPLPTISKKGPLPKHLKLVKAANGTATISGTPVKAGVYTFSLRAAYGAGALKVIVLQPFTLTVHD
jgi:predicted outer membrane repeat protein